MTTLRANFVSGQLQENPLSSGATTLTMSGRLQNLPTVASPDIAKLTFDPEGEDVLAGSGTEIVFVTAYTSGAGTATIQRGREGTTAKPHSQGTRIVHAPTKADWDEIVSQSAPVGEIKMYTGTTPPTGWLFCDGTAVSRTTYAALFAVIGTKYGAGNGSTTFNLPDTPDKAIIGAATMAGQGDSGTLAHTHSTTGGSSHNHGGATGGGSSHDHAVSGTSAAGASHTHAFTGSSSSTGSHSHDVTGTSDVQDAGHTHTLGAHVHVYNQTDPVTGNNNTGSPSPDQSGGISVNHAHDSGSYATDTEASHAHTVGTYDVGNEAAHTHGFGSINVATEAAHTHSVTSESSHTHTASSASAGATLAVGFIIRAT